MANYYLWSGATGAANGTDWANAYLTIVSAVATKAAGDTIFVAHDHSETASSTMTILSPGTWANPFKIFCVNRAGSVPPVEADRRATAQLSTTGTGGFSLTGTNSTTHYDGIIFNMASGGISNTNLMLPLSNGAHVRMDNCAISIQTSGVSGKIAIGGTAFVAGTFVEWNNVTVQFALASQYIDVSAGFKWRNTPDAIKGSVMPTSLLRTNTGVSGGAVECAGVDFSAMGSGTTLVLTTTAATGFKFKFIDCKINASVTKAVAPTASPAFDIEFLRCGATGGRSQFYTNLSGILNEELTTVRTSGAEADGVPLSWKVDTTANTSYTTVFECPPIAVWNDSLSSVTATVECAGSAVPNDDEIWVDVEYIGANNPRGSFANDGRVSWLTSAAAQTTSSAGWSGSPASKYKLETTFTPAAVGWIYARVKCGKPSSTFYIDPMVALT